MTTPAPVWRKLADKIESDIRSGRLAPGSLLPSLREMQHDGTGSTSVIAAMRELDSRGLVVKVPGKGTYVVDVIPPKSKRPSEGDLLDLIEDLRSRVADLERWRDEQ